MEAEAGNSGNAAAHAWVSIQLGPSGVVWIDVDRLQLMETLLDRPPACGTVRAEGERGPIQLSAELKPLRRGGKIRVAGPNCSEGTPILSLVKAIARARDWYERAEPDAKLKGKKAPGDREAATPRTQR